MSYVLLTKICKFMNTIAHFLEGDQQTGQSHLEKNAFIWRFVGMTTLSQARESLTVVVQTVMKEPTSTEVGLSTVQKVQMRLP